METMTYDMKAGRAGGMSRGALLLLLIALLVRPVLGAADHVGRVTLPNGVPVPGARVTASQGETRVVTTTSVEGIYRFAGLELTPAVRAAMAAWLQENGREKRAAHHYDPASFGLDEARLQRDYGEYRARHLA